MKPKTSIGRLLAVVISAALLVIFTIFLAAPLLRVLRSAYGGVKYWVSGLAVLVVFLAIGLEPFAFLAASLWITVGVYSEAEYQGFAGVASGLASLVLGSVVLIGSVVGWAKLLDVDLMTELQSSLTKLIASLGPAAKNSHLFGFDVNADFLIYQIPSGVFLLLMLSLAFALMIDQKVALICGLPFEKVANHVKLLDFKLPDAFIWLTMLSFLLSFYRLPQLWINFTALNVFYILMGLYFFQGLAVLEVSFWYFRIGSFVRFLIYFIIVGQLFFLLSAVGVIDYWVDFRGRMKKSKLSSGGANNENI